MWIKLRKKKKKERKERTSWLDIVSCPGYRCPFRLVRLAARDRVPWCFTRCLRVLLGWLWFPGVGNASIVSVWLGFLGIFTDFLVFLFLLAFVIGRPRNRSIIRMARQSHRRLSIALFRSLSKGKKRTIVGWREKKSSENRLRLEQFPGRWTRFRPDEAESDGFSSKILPKKKEQRPQNKTHTHTHTKRFRLRKKITRPGGGTPSL